MENMKEMLCDMEEKGKGPNIHIIGEEWTLFKENIAENSLDWR